MHPNADILRDASHEADRTMNRRGFLGAMLAGLAMPLRPRAVTSITAASLASLESLDDMLRAVYSKSVPLVVGTPSVLWSIIPKSGGFE